MWNFPGGLVAKNPPANTVQSLGGEDPWRKKWQPLQYSCLGNLMDKGVWWAIVHGITKKIGHDLVTKQQ